MASAAKAQTAVKAESVEVKVIGQGTLADSGYPFLLVTSATEFGRVHVVSYSYEGAFVGSRAVCDCMAAQYGKSCKHVLVARAWLAGYGARSAPRQKLDQPQSQVNRTRGFSLMK